jgi:transposase
MEVKEMPKRRYLTLSEEQKAELERLRDHDAKAHIREKAAILLKIAEGMSPHAASQMGGLKRHHPDTVYKWLAWYEDQGIQRFEVQPGRGRKPAFSPSEGK